MTQPASERKRRGAWATPPHLVEQVVGAVIDEGFVVRRRGRPLRILDPACGDGRFLTASLAAVRELGANASALGVDVHQDAVDRAAAGMGIEAFCADALHSDRLTRHAGTFDLVIGNPPFLSQLAASTSRGGSSRHGGGPYADAAAEFLSLAADLVDPDGGRLAFVLPQSLLSARDAGPVRERIDAQATMFWSAWTGDLDFDAQVVTCAVAFEFGGDPHRNATHGSTWSHVVTSRSGIPPMPEVLADAVRGAAPLAGILGDRARLNANFRDEYYGMIPAVGDHRDGPPLVTSGLIDPGRLRWGERPVRFAKRRFDAPRVDRRALDPKMQRWATARLVPKVLIANQTSIVEAVCDAEGSWLPAVPVVAAYPHGESTTDRVDGAWRIAAVLTSPAVSAWAWHRRGGTGLSSTTIRLGPTMLAELPWPHEPLDAAVTALRDGDPVSCGAAVDAAYGVSRGERSALSAWWEAHLARIEERTERSAR